MKLTPWFSGLECPVRAGVYERKLYNYHTGDPLIVYSYWDGQHWYIGANEIEDAVKMIPLGPTMTLYREWRGLEEA